MPKPNQTMLDQLVKTFKSTGNKAPFREMRIRGEFTDPMIKARANQQLAGNKLIKLDPSWRAPERVKYQRGLDALIDARSRPIREKYEDVSGELEDVQNEFEEAFDEAKEDLVDDIGLGMRYFEAPEVRYGFDAEEGGDLTPELFNSSLADYWPSRFKAPSWYSDRGSELGDLADEYEGRLDYMDSPEYRMELQRQTPRYRNYQRAMRQRQENAQMGRLNAAIMNLYRRGYSMPEIREILRNQRMK